MILDLGIKPYYSTTRGDLYHADCLDILPLIPDKSVDMILCDLPYGTTACSWDTIIPFEPLWAEYNRIALDNSVIALTANEPFSSYLRISNIKKYKYDWYWIKTKYSNFLCLGKQPAKNCENICVFYNKQPTYNPQMLNGTPYSDKGRKKVLNKQQQIGCKKYTRIDNNGKRFPNSTIFFSNGNNNNIHPTQKPIALFNYLIKTYTNDNDLVLDNCSGSGTTAVACEDLNRRWICIEKEEKYCELSAKRIEQFLSQGKLF